MFDGGEIGLFRLVDLVGTTVVIGKNKAQPIIVGKFINGGDQGLFRLFGLAVLSIEVGKLNTGCGIVGKIIDHCPGGCLRLFRLALGLIEEKEYLVVGKFVRIDFDCFFKGGFRSLEILTGGKQSPLNGIESVQLRIKGKGFIEQVFGFVEVAVNEFDVGHESQSINIVGMLLENGLCLFTGAFFIPGHQEEFGCFQAGVGIGGVKAAGALQFFKGFFSVTHLQIQQAELITGIGIFGIDLDGVA